MASAQVIITDTKELKELQKRIQSLKLNSNDRRKLLHSIGVEIESQIEERFENQTDSSGSRWADISAKTREYYSKKGIGGSLLSRTRQLRDTIESQVESDSLIVGATKIYAATHNYGDSRRNIPKREFIGLSAENISEIKSVIDDFIETNKLKRA